MKKQTLNLTLVSAITLGLVFVYAPVAAQIGQPRAIERAIDINVEQALIRVPVKLKLTAAPQPVTYIEWSEDESRLFALRQGGIYEVWNTATGAIESNGQLEPSDINGVAFAFGGAVVVTQANGRTSILRPARSGSIDISDNIGGVLQPNKFLLEHPSLPVVYALSESGQMRAIDVDAGRARPLFNLNVAAGKVAAIDRSGNYLALPTTIGVGVWDIRTGLQAEFFRQDLPSDVLKISFGSTIDTLTVVTASGQVTSIARGKASSFNMCSPACNLVTASIARDEDRVRAITVENKLIDWRRRVRRASVQEPLPGTELPVSSPAASTSLLAYPAADTTIRLLHFDDLKSGTITLASTQAGPLILDQQGRFDGSTEAQDQAAWGGEQLNVTLSNFAKQYYEPGLLRKWLAKIAEPDYLASPLSSITDGVLLPPRTALNARLGAVRPEGRIIQVGVTAQDLGGGLGEVYLYHQGIRVAPRRITKVTETVVDKRRQKQVEFEVFAVNGANVFAATAENKEGILSPTIEQNVPSADRTREPTLHVLVAGINKYNISRLNLEYARADAEGLAEAVRSVAGRVYQNVRMTRLYDQDVQRASMQKALDDLALAGPDDTVLVYVAGHGEVFDDEFYFLTAAVKFPFRIADVKQNGISFTEFTEKLEALNARRVVFLLDTCKSGDALVNLESRERDQRVLTVGGGRVGLYLLAATGRGQLATELKDLGHGLFTYSLLEGIRGKADLAPIDGIVSAREVVSYAGAQVRELSAKYGTLPQAPTSLYRGFDFALSRPVR